MTKSAIRYMRNMHVQNYCYMKIKCCNYIVKAKSNPNRGAKTFFFIFFVSTSKVRTGLENYNKLNSHCLSPQ